MVEGKTIFCFQAEDGIRDAQESRGLGDVYKRQDDSLAHGALSPLYYTRGDDRRGGAGQPARRDDLRLSLIHI